MTVSRYLWAVVMLIAAADARAQSGRRRGTVEVTGREYGSVTVRSAEANPEGQVTWSCASGSTVDVRFGSEAADTGSMVTYLVARFDDAPADTVFLIRGALRRGDRGWFTGRARDAKRLSLRFLGADPGSPGREVSFDLDRLGATLGRLACLPTPGSDSPARRLWPPPEGLVPNPDPSALSSASPAAAPRELAEVDQAPEVVNGPEFQRELSRRYPHSQLNSGVQGQVIVRFLILEDGRISPGTVSLVQSSHPAFEPVVREWLPVLHFRPARVGGRPVKVWVVQPVVFATAN